MADKINEIDVMNNALQGRDEIFEALIGDNPASLIKDASKIPTDDSMLKPFMVQAIRSVHESDKFFGPEGRKLFLNVYGFDYPGIMPYEQEMSRSFTGEF